MIAGLKQWLTKSQFTVAIVSLLFVLGAIVAAFTIRIEVFPSEQTPPLLFVTVTLEGAMPVPMVEAAVALPIEGVIRSLSRVRRISSTTSQTNVSLSLVLEPKTNLDLKTLEILEAINSLGASPYYTGRAISVTRLSPDAQPVMRLAIGGLEKTADPVALAMGRLEPFFEAMPGVARLEFAGVYPSQFEFRVEESRLRQLGLSGTSLLGNFKAAGRRQSVGILALVNSDSVLPLFVSEPKRQGIDYQRLPIKPNSPYVLSDISTFTEVDRSLFEIRRLDGNPTAFAELYNRQGADLFQLQSHVLEALKDLKAKLKDVNVAVEMIADSVADLRSALFSVLENLLQAIVITFIVVWVGLRRMRDTVLICLSIPLTLLLTILVLRATGGSLNILTLSGLTLCIGMVIDNAVLLLERYRELAPESSSRLQAAAGAAGDVLPALGIASFTNALIFLPVAFIEAREGFLGLLVTFQVPLVASLIVSVFAVIVIMPQTLRWASPVAIEPPSTHAEKRERFFRWLYQQRRKTALATLCLSYFLWILVSEIATSDSTGQRDSFQSVVVRFDAQLSTARKKAVFDMIEKHFIDLRSEMSAAHVIGNFNAENQQGTIQVFPTVSADPDAAMAILKDRLADVKSRAPSFAGVSLTSGPASGGRSGDPGRVEYFDFSGPSLNVLLAFQDEVRLLLETVPAIRLVEHAEVSGEKFVAVKIEADSTLLKSVTLADISKEVQARRGVAQINDVFINDRRASLRLLLTSPNQTSGLAEALAEPIQVKDSVFSLDQIGRSESQYAIRHSSRSSQKSSLRFGIGVKQNSGEVDLDAARAQARSVVEGMELPPGVTLVDPYAIPDDSESDEATLFLVGMSVVLIFLVLAGLFESVFVPLAIMASVPIALLFGVLGLRLAGMELDIMGRLSLVLLVGAAVNNAIILVDQFRSLQSKGMSRSEAIIQGSASRLRAVLITATIQILSVLPIAMGQSTVMGIPYASLGVSMIAGMLGSTVVTLIVLPALYDWADSFSDGRHETAELSESRAEA
jgi:HAE1 family hydrophobic/amphiphilic exporter-1